ncbi:MAG: DUF692 domain-containing protein [Candidatus Berkiella sp.]
MRFKQETIQGAGIGLRAPHYQYILEQLPEVPWFEAISENYLGDKAIALSYLLAIREHYPLTLHGVSLSIGSADPLNLEYLKQLKQLIQHVEPAMVSDHLCWTSVDGRYFPDLFPLPHHERVIAHVVDRIMKVQDFLGQRILLENVSRYLEFSESRMTEWEFLSEVAKRADCDILLDINNLYINAFNHQFCLENYLRSLPSARVKQFHVAGHQKETRHLLDTHDRVVSKAVWDAFALAIEIVGPKPVLIEWDTHIPPFTTLLSESQIAGCYYQSQNITA